MYAVISGTTKLFRPTRMALTIRFAHLLYEIVTCIRFARVMILVATLMLSSKSCAAEEQALLSQPDKSSSSSDDDSSGGDIGALASTAGDRPSR